MIFLFVRKQYKSFRALRRGNIGTHLTYLPSRNSCTHWCIISNNSLGRQGHEVQNQLRDYPDTMRQVSEFKDHL